MEIKNIIFAALIGYLIGCVVARIYYDIMYRKLLKTNIAILKSALETLTFVRNQAIWPKSDNSNPNHDDKK